MRDAYRLLREERRNMQVRTIGLFSFPVIGKISQEGLLKQMKDLAESDDAIDDWACILEHAENRRYQIRRKLLEHTAAALVSQVIETQPSRPANPPTPPATPRGPRTPDNTKRRHAESVKIYAGRGMQSLFADIEQEICTMTNTNQMENPGSAPVLSPMEQGVPLFSGTRRSNGWRANGPTYF